MQTARDYYPFGMIMPGRMFTALTVPGGSVTGATQVNRFTVPVDLALTSRSGNEPTQYVASLQPARPLYSKADNELIKQTVINL